MRSGITFTSLFASVLLHATLLALLALNIQLIPNDVVQPAPNVNIVKAVTVDSRKVDEELNRLKQIEQQKEAEQKKKEEDLKSRLDDLQKKADAVEARRKEEEQRLADVEQQSEQEQKAAEQKKQQQDEQDRKRKQDADRKKKAEEEARAKQAQEDLKKQLDAEQKEQSAEQQQREQTELDRYALRIQDAIGDEFNMTGLPPGLSCVLEIRMLPGGAVASVSVSKSSGNAIFDQRAELAVSKASPLPVPDDAELFEKMRVLNLTFVPKS